MNYNQLPTSQRHALNLYVKLMRASNRATGNIHAHLRDDNLTVSQFGVLEALYHLGPLSPGELGEKILKSNANLTTVLDSLEKKSLAERRRSAEDRRKVTVYLTDSGRELIARVFSRHAKIAERVFEFLSAEEQNTLSAILKKFK